MDAKKILKDLQYRIESAAESDPERQNAIRLRDRLLARFHMSLSDIVDVRKTRRFGYKYTKQEMMLVVQYFMKRLATGVG